MKTENLSFKERVLKVQEELNAPKNIYNDYGGFWYRNAEGILEAAKPLCSAYRLIINTNYRVEQLGDRYYIIASATLTDVDSDAVMTREAPARETLSKKKMDDSQLTGAAISYAAKYALGALLAIDDGRDPDDNKPEDNQPEPQNNQPAGNNQYSSGADNKVLDNQLSTIYDQMAVLGYGAAKQAEMSEFFKVPNLESLSLQQANRLIGILKGRIKKKEEE